MSWNQLTAIIEEAAELDRLEAAKKPVECPVDGTPLLTVGGILHCPFDGWQYPRDA